MRTVQDVHPRKSIPADLRRLARRQGGIATAEQCRDHGIGKAVLRRLTDAEAIERVGFGVYRLAPPPAPWTSLAHAAILVAGDGAVLHGRAAAHLWGLVERQPLITVRSGQAVSARAAGPWRITRTRGLPEAVGTPPRTTLAVTILDLVARSGSATGHGRLVYPPDHPDHGMILRHLGGLRPGETRPVPPFP